MIHISEEEEEEQRVDDTKASKNDSTNDDNKKRRRKRKASTPFAAEENAVEMQVVYRKKRLLTQHKTDGNVRFLRCLKNFETGLKCPLWIGLMLCNSIQKF